MLLTISLWLGGVSWAAGITKFYVSPLGDQNALIFFMEQLDVRVFLYVYRACHNALIHDVCFTKAETKLPSSSVQETNGWVNFIWVLDEYVSLGQNAREMNSQHFSTTGPSTYPPYIGADSEGFSQKEPQQNQQSHVINMS